MPRSLLRGYAAAVSLYKKKDHRFQKKTNRICDNNLNGDFIILIIILNGNLIIIKATLKGNIAIFVGIDILCLISNYILFLIRIFR
jgi:hypothetical protein